jgi:hypothetical protein
MDISVTPTLAVRLGAENTVALASLVLTRAPAEALDGTQSFVELDAFEVVAVNALL